MALSKGLRLLGRLEASGDSSVLLEARGRGDCLLFEAGTVATLGESAPPGAPGRDPAARPRLLPAGRAAQRTERLPLLRLRETGTSLPRGDRSPVARGQRGMGVVRREREAWGWFV